MINWAEISVECPKAFKLFGSLTGKATTADWSILENFMDKQRLIVSILPDPDYLGRPITLFTCRIEYYEDPIEVVFQAGTNFGTRDEIKSFAFTEAFKALEFLLSLPALKRYQGFQYMTTAEPKPREEVVTDKPF